MRVHAKLNGKYIGVALSGRQVYADRDKAQSWEVLELTDHGDGLFDALFVSADRQLAISDVGGLETRDKGAFGLFEQLRATTQPEGPSLLYRYRPDGSVQQPVLVLEEVL